MTEERLKEIKDSLDTPIWILTQRTFAKSYMEIHLQQELELYNEVVRLREIIKDVIKICENEKKYIYDKPKRDENTGKLIYGNKKELDLVNKTKILEILEQHNLTLEQTTGIAND